MKISITNYKTGQEIWRGEIDKKTWAKYQRQADKHTGACASSVFVKHLTKQPVVIFAEPIS